MNIETLRLYCRVVQTNSFSQGAREIGVTQSAASQSIRQLEGDLGVLLLDRSKRPFTMTAQGEKFYKACRDLLEGFDRVRDEVALEKRRIEGTVRVAAIYSVGLHDMGVHMQRFRNLYPEARVRLECLHPKEVIRSVEDDMSDVGLISYPGSNRALTVIPLWEEPLRLVCPPAHHLAKNKNVCCADLNGVPFVAFDSDLAIRKAIDRVLRQENARVDVVMEFDNVESIKEGVLLGAGVSILPEPVFQKEIAMRSLRAIPLDRDDLARPIGLIHRRHKQLPLAVDRFIEILKEQ
ncbi:LysR family transcriptional regulator [Nitrospinota bacterium]